MEDDFFAQLGFWLATAMPFTAAAGAFLVTRRMRLLWRGIVLALVNLVTLPAGFVSVLMAIDRGPQMRRAVDGIAALPMFGVWAATAMLSATILVWMSLDSEKRHT